eukprot:TRINITY_DN49685_c0_g1_i1.p1 TRINITY_DN49685_c0_g1~~TRINITY_DN49685_c0_g1_i1.p1  ORF type:complete len:367 (+),score=79.87 TRINITY_DN49685_c0_g1_i1:59-1102(+)
MGGQCSSSNQSCRSNCCDRDAGDAENLSAPKYAGTDEMEAGDQEPTNRAAPGEELPAQFTKAALAAAAPGKSEAPIVPKLPIQSKQAGESESGGLAGLLPKAATAKDGTSPEVAPEPLESAAAQEGGEKKAAAPKSKAKTKDTEAGSDGKAKAKAKAKAGSSDAAANEKTQAKAKDGAVSEKPQATRADARLLSGVWLDNSDLRPLAMIKDSQVTWIGAESQGPCQISLLPGRKISIQFNGKEHVATALLGSPPRLSWEDGSIWVRDDLQGCWENKQEKARVGEIKNGKVHWHERFSNAKPTPLSPLPVFPKSTVKMELSEVCSAIYEPGPPAKLTWSDGETWERVS